MSVIALDILGAHFPAGELCGRFALKGNGRRFTLTQPFSFVDGDLRIDVPPGFVTDFNSVPRLLWTWFPPWECPEAGVVHDYGYNANPGNRDRGEWDALHRRIMEIKGERKSRRLAVWLGIRAGGWAPWGDYRRAEIPHV
jgi:hypothetical protein